MKITKHILNISQFSVLCVVSALTVWAQGAGTIIKGTVKDPSAAVIPNAAVHVTGGGQTRDAKTDNNGQFTVAIPPGQYEVRVSAPGFVDADQQNVSVTNGQTNPLDISMQITTAAQQVDVNSSGVGTVSVDPSANAGAIVLSEQDLDSLPDDPDDLEAQLEAMAGPAAGPNGPQIFIDGFSGGQMPPKSSIREIRINSNPFASEFDTPGFGRIQIFTKPGTDAYHASGFFIFGDHDLDTRNPFVNGPMPNYNNRQIEGSFSGPLGKKLSWFLDVNQRQFNTAQLINGETLDANFNPVSYNSTFATPSTNWSVNPRIDYAISQSNTLVLRFEHNTRSSEGGVGGFSLPTQEIFNGTKANTVQATETMVIGTKSVNEILFQYDESVSNANAAFFPGPTVSVASAFTSGGNEQANFTHNKLYELQEMNTITNGKHTMKFGARLRENQTDVKSISNFNGTYSFSTPNNPGASPCFNGTFDPNLPALANPTSIQDYQYTELALQQGYSMTDILNAGCGPTSYSLDAGPSTFAVNQFDAGIFAQDDWRVRTNITVSGGLRYEVQTNISDKTDFAPRLAVSWAPGGKAGQTSKTVLRGGSGIFYYRFPIADVLNALRYNGFGQQNYLINAETSPTAAYPALAYFGTPTGMPPVSLLATSSQALYQVDPNLKASYMIQNAGSIERALPGRTTLTVNVTDSRGVHDLRQRQINAYLPGTYNPATQTPGVLPYPNEGFIYNYESTGMYKELQVITSVNSRVNSHVSLNGYYAWTDYHTNTNGFPMNQYNTSYDWGRAAIPMNRVNLVGTVGLPLGWTASPSFFFMSSTPFNITDGFDYNGDGITNDRPAFAPAGAACGGSIKCTPFGNFNTAPGANYVPMPINYANGPKRWDADIRFTRYWGWGERRNVASATGGGGGGGGDRGGGGRGGGGGGFGGGGRGGGFGQVGSSTSHRYNVGLTIAATDIFNHVNFANPIGSLNSPFFGESLNAVSTGQGLGAGGITGTRRIQLTLRFTY
jgi:uncharacterized membrane protein YgcG